MSVAGSFALAFAGSVLAVAAYAQQAPAPERGAVMQRDQPMMCGGGSQPMAQGGAQAMGCGCPMMAMMRGGMMGGGMMGGGAMGGGMMQPPAAPGGAQAPVQPMPNAPKQ